MADRPRKISFELAVVIAATLLAAVAGHFLNLFELMYDISRSAEWLNLDEMLLSVVVLTVGFAWLSIRRHRDLHGAVSGREQALQKLSKANETFDRLLENLKNDYFFYRHNTEGVFEFLSPSITDVLGYTVEEFCKHYTVYLTDDPINKEVERHTELSIKGIRQPPYRVEIYHRNGTRRDLEVVEIPVRDKTGEVVAVEGIAHDITPIRRSKQQLKRYQEQLEQLVNERTEALNQRNQQLVMEIAEREQVEQALKENEASLRAIIEALPDMIFILDETGKILDYRGNPEQPFMPPEQLIGKRLHDIFKPEMADHILRHIEETFATGQTQRFNYEVNDEGRPLVREARVVRLDKERVLAVVSDITESRNLQQRLKHTQFVMDRAPEAIFWLTENGHFTYVNDAACHLLGYSHEELLEMSVADIKQTDDDTPFSFFWEAVKEAGTLTFESMHKARDGRLLPVEVTAAFVEFNGIEYECAFVRDLTQQKQDQQQLKMMQFAIDHVLEAAFWTDSEGRFIYVNDAACRNLGYSRKELLGMTVFDIDTDFPQENWPAHWKDLQTHSSVTLESVHRTRDGREFPVEIRANYVQFEGVAYNFAFVLDITERKQAEQQMLQTEKLESLSLLAGGIAHDFNNLLTGIVGNLNLARLCRNLPADLHTYLAQAEEAAQSTRELTAQLLTFSKGGEPIKDIVRIGDLIRRSAQFVTHGSNTRLRFEIPEDLANAEVDASQVSRVIQNLVLNALQAMPNGGTVTIRAEDRRLNDNEERDLAAGDYIRITVEDEGSGISPDIINHVFDPYFTTKESGTGLGLATCHSIVRRHGGTISVQSEPDRGTTFIVHLPASNRTNEAVADTKPIPAVSVRGNILVMDDEAFIQKLMRKMLEHAGHSVTCAANGEAAVRLYQDAQQSGRPFDLVILDLTVAGGSGGIATIKKLRELDPAVRALVCSGYGADGALAQYRRHGFIGVVSKPFKFEQLRDAVALALTSHADAVSPVADG